MAFDCVQHSKFQRSGGNCRTEHGCLEWFSIIDKVYATAVLSPYLFNIYAEYIMKRAFDGFIGQVSVGGLAVNKLYTDDITLVTTRTPNELLV